MTTYELLIIVGAPAIISFLFQLIFNSIRNSNAKNKIEDTSLKLGVQALLRDRLMQGYRFFIKQGYIDISDKENYDNMYQKYHSLGKNGVMDSMHAEIMNLPTSKK